MTSANEKWQKWMNKHWRQATNSQRRMLWDFWCEAILAGRLIERERGPEPVRRKVTSRSAGGGA